jgi:flavin reductase (DIM6/NTAB) family NADH-FMN oxidoreductase RutF
MRGSTSYVADELDGTSYAMLEQTPFDVGPTDTSGPALAEADDDFKAAIGLLASGIVLITTWHDGRPWGLTISSCSSLSLGPARVVISIGRHTTTYANIASDRCFGVNILGRDHKPLAMLGATAGSAKFIDSYCSPVPDISEAPAVHQALGYLDCVAESRRHVADHVLVIGRVRRAAVARCEPSPLVYFDRTFWALGDRL